jgi:drug/metabolite transporter (DMT)-like permease
MAGVRFLVAGIILYGINLARTTERPTLVHWRSALVVGALLITIGNGGVVWAELRIPSGIAAIVVAVAPCWFVLFDWLWLGNARPRLKTVCGIVLGFIGLAILIVPGILGSAGSLNIAGIGVVMFGSVCWAFGSIFSKRAPLPKSQPMATGMEMICGGALLVVLGLVTGEAGSFVMSAVSMRSALAWLYLMVFGSLVAFSAYVWLLHKVPAAQVSTYAYVNPLVAVLLGWALAGEKFTASMAAAACAIIAGVVVITISSQRETQR